MIIKQGVSIRGVRPEIVLALVIVNDIYKRFGQELVVTEITGGKHGVGSLHYVGQAADIRTSYFAQGEAKVVADEIRIALGKEFDVVLESTHIHLEFQPK